MFHLQINSKTCVLILLINLWQRKRPGEKIEWDEAGCHRTFGHVLSLFITSYLSVCACRHVSANDLGTKKGVRTSTKQWVCGHIHVCVCVTCVKVHTLCVLGVCVNILCVCSLTASMCVCHVRLWTSVRLSAKMSHVCLGASVCACRDIAILVCQALLWAVMTSLLIACRNERRTADIAPLSPFLTLFLLPYIYIFRHADNT